MVKLLSSKTKVLTCIKVVILATITKSEQTVDVESIAAIIGQKLLSVNPNLTQILVNSTSTDSNHYEKEYLNKYENMRKSATTALAPLFKISATEKKESEETVILQNPPQNISFRSNIRKITTQSPIAKPKQLQLKIERLLNKEVITDKTKSLINYAFDKLINQMDLQCVQNNKNLTPKSLRLGQSEKKARRRMLKSWRNQFTKLLNKYCAQQDLSDFSGNKENIQFLSNLREFFFEMHSDFANLTRKYDLNCQVVEADNVLRASKKFSVVQNAFGLLKDGDHQKKNPGECTFYIICDYELQQFLGRFYTEIQTGINRIFHNYEVMYLADFANEPMPEKTIFRTFMKDASKKVLSKLNETFSKESDKIDLESSNDIKEKVREVKRFIDETVIHIKLLIDDVLTVKGTALPNKLKFTVKTDIMTNTDIELSDIQEKIKLNMCESFQKCHGRDTRRWIRHRLIRQNIGRLEG